MQNIKTVEEVPLDAKYMLFRSCAVSNKCPGIEAATRYVFAAMGIILEESEDHACCGGSAIIFTSIGQVNSTVLMTARNLAISEEKNLNTLTMCNGCYKNLNEIGGYIRSNPEVKNLVNGKLSNIGREYQGKYKVYHVMEVLYSQRNMLKEKVKHSLKGLRFAVHYGCHYSFGAKKYAIDDPFYTSAIEKTIEGLGGEIAHYPEEKTCCGSGILNNTYIDKEFSMPAVLKKLETLNMTNADAVIVMCPYCMMNLDRMQFQIKMSMGKNYMVPVLHITQLVGLTMGASFREIGFETNLTSMEVLMKKWEGFHA